MSNKRATEQEGENEKEKSSKREKAKEREIYKNDKNVRNKKHTPSYGDADEFFELALARTYGK